LSSSQLSDEGLRALCSLTALTDLDLRKVHLYGDEVVSALCSFNSLTALSSSLRLYGTDLSLEELNIIIIIINMLMPAYQ